ncbi:hypothetical protein [Actinacidiphila oryziradicis]|uniref:Uncharacterized protein n=1 Tax=Actinacidiphila oryziradicis TaxID=2571141 RepID=A0A4U0RM65_9ACTN|nr:hypothetical protein [Actinacidiphila oryziradicis]TJZ95880.1 hypothetical protein FCI23_51685 [Actinacidiphila oryziradicis]
MTTPRHALADANRLMEQLSGEQRADTWFGHCEQKHHVHLSHALTALGDTRRARESQDHALALSAPTSTMTRTLLTIDAAACTHPGTAIPNKPAAAPPPP